MAKEERSEIFSWCDKVAYISFAASIKVPSSLRLACTLQPRTNSRSASSLPPAWAHPEPCGDVETFACSSSCSAGFARRCFLCGYAENPNAFNTFFSFSPLFSPLFFLLLSTCFCSRCSLGFWRALALQRAHAGLLNAQWDLICRIIELKGPSGSHCSRSRRSFRRKRKVLSGRMEEFQNASSAAATIQNDNNAICSVTCMWNFTSRCCMYAQYAGYTVACRLSKDLLLAVSPGRNQLVVTCSTFMLQMHHGCIRFQVCFHWFCQKWCLPCLRLCRHPRIKQIYYSINNLNVVLLLCHQHDGFNSTFYDCVTRCRVCWAASLERRL